MLKDKTFLFLGAQGYSGQLIYDGIKGRSNIVAPTLSRGQPLAEQLVGYAPLLKPGDLVLNCLGPFQSSYLSVIEFCLAHGLHYFDINAQWQVFEAIRQLGPQAERAQCMLLPGIGFDVVASDCLIGHVGRRCSDISRLQIGISGLELISRGSAKTLTELIGEPLRIRRRGRIVAEPRILESQFDFGAGERRALGVSWGDISTAWHSSAVPNIEVFFEATPALAGAVFANRTFGWLASDSRISQAAQGLVKRLPAGPGEDVRTQKSATVVVRAVTHSGQQVESRLNTREAYSFTADAAAAVLEHFAHHAALPGFQTPFTALGADFVLGLPECQRSDTQ
ncbi:saccharopine dehydrogenase NADP-binding domain-containing protein [Luminiphilus sp.]|nr:saccharopine dehydrogenase NADP-binding domain-containing protein [Luminiphilus sp.]